MTDNIDKSFLCIPKDLSKHIVKIDIGSFKKYGGSCDIDEDTFYKYMDKVYRYTKKYQVYEYKSYMYRNMEMCINKKTKTKYFRSLYPIKSIIDKNYCIRIFENKYISKEDFPILSEYHDITDKKIRNYKYRKFDDTNNAYEVDIYFIEERKSLKDKKDDKVIRRVALEFNNKNSNSKDLAKEILKAIL